METPRGSGPGSYLASPLLQQSNKRPRTSETWNQRNPYQQVIDSSATAERIAHIHFMRSSVTARLLTAREHGARGLGRSTRTTGVSACDGNSKRRLCISLIETSVNHVMSSIGVICRMFCRELGEAKRRQTECGAGCVAAGCSEPLRHQLTGMARGR